MDFQSFTLPMLLMEAAICTLGFLLTWSNVKDSWGYATGRRGVYLRRTILVWLGVYAIAAVLIFVGLAWIPLVVALVAISVIVVGGFIGLLMCPR